MKAFFLTVSGVFGVIPGLAIMLGELGTPPEKNGLFGGVVEAFGVLTLIILWVNRGKIAKLSRSKVTKVSIVLGILCLVLVGGYFCLFDLCVVKHELRGSAYFPLWTSGKIAKMVEKANGRGAAIEYYGIDAVREAIREMPTYALSLTSIVLLLVYQGVFTSLTAAFGLLGIYQKKSLNSKRGTT